MFYGARAIKQDLSKWDTSAVTNLSEMWGSTENVENQRLAHVKRASTDDGFFHA